MTGTASSRSPRPPPATPPLPALLLASLLALGGCAAAPLAGDAQTAPPVPPARWSSSEQAPAPTPTSLARWWQRFDDAALTQLIEDALQHSPTVQSSIAALRQSRAQADVAAAGLLPGLGGSASAQRSRTGDRSHVDAFSVGLTASWEPDLFGGARAGVDAARADARAAAMALGDVQVSLAAEVALAYVDLRSAQARVAIAQDNLTSQDETLQIARWRHQAGLVSALDVDQAQAQAEQTRAQVPALQTTLAQARHRLAALTGRAPGELAELGTAPVPLPPDDLVMAFPADTLRQRADVRQAEAQVQAAWARVAEADATRMPALNLSGSLGLQALTLGTLTQGGSVVRSVLAGLSLPLFDGGAIAGTIRARQAALEQAQAGHRASVLAALQDVEDALVALQGDRSRRVSLGAAAAAAANAEQLARQQYQAGLIDFASVLETQRTLLSAQDSAASVRASLATDHVSLYKALGGGWAGTADGDGQTGSGTPSPNTAAR